MALIEIDTTDLGQYKGPRGHVYESRVNQGAFGSFTVSRINDWQWNCQQSGHSNHEITAIIFDGDLKADCDCYDFQRYGAVFNRACMHIWRLYLHEDLKEY